MQLYLSYLGYMIFFWVFLPPYVCMSASTIFLYNCRIFPQRRNRLPQKKPETLLKIKRRTMLYIPVKMGPENYAKDLRQAQYLVQLKYRFLPFSSSWHWAGDFRLAKIVKSTEFRESYFVCYVGPVSIWKVR